MSAGPSRPSTTRRRAPPAATEMSARELDLSTREPDRPATSSHLRRRTMLDPASSSIGLAPALDDAESDVFGDGGLGNGGFAGHPDDELFEATQTGPATQPQSLPNGTQQGEPDHCAYLLAPVLLLMPTLGQAKGELARCPGRIWREPASWPASALALRGRPGSSTSPARCCRTPLTQGHLGQRARSTGWHAIGRRRGCPVEQPRRRARNDMTSWALQSYAGRPGQARLPDELCPGNLSSRTGQRPAQQATGRALSCYPSSHSWQLALGH
jgi:hypothetical protein